MVSTEEKLIRDARRIEALYSLCLMDTPAELSFDRLTNLACRLLDVPVALVSLVDKDRQFFKSQQGLPEPYASARETPLSHSFCKHAVATGEPLIIEDSRKDVRVMQNLAIRDLNVIAYLGIPLFNSDGLALGTLCAIDSEPRQWSENDIANLSDLAQSVMTEIELRSELELRRQTEEKLRERQHFINTAMETVPLGVIIVDMTTETLVYDNDNLVQMLGYNAAIPLTYNRLANDTHPEDIDLLTNPETPLNALTPDETVQLEWRLEDSDGSWRLFEVTCTVFTSQTGTSGKQILTAWQDITERKRAESEIMRLELDKQQSKLLRQFVQNTSHDLRTPLTSLQTKLDLLRRYGETDTTSERRLDQMQQKVSHMGDILREFETLSKVLGREGLRVGRLHINQIVQGAAEHTLKMLPDISSEMLAYDLHDDLPVLRGDAQQLRFAVQGLIENALRYNNEDNPVRVQTLVKDGCVGIAVIDNGTGIPEDVIAHIFEPFYKGNAARTAGDGRAGLGLSIVKQVVDWHQGYVDVVSTLGEGTHFTVWLPIDKLEISDALLM